MSIQLQPIFPKESPAIVTNIQYNDRVEKNGPLLKIETDNFEEEIKLNGRTFELIVGDRIVRIANQSITDFFLRVLKENPVTDIQEAQELINILMKHGFVPAISAEKKFLDDIFSEGVLPKKDWLKEGVSAAMLGRMPYELSKDRCLFLVLNPTSINSFAPRMVGPPKPKSKAGSFTGVIGTKSQITTSDIIAIDPETGKILNPENVQRMLEKGYFDRFERKESVRTPNMLPPAVREKIVEILPSPPKKPTLQPPAEKQTLLFPTAPAVIPPATPPPQKQITAVQTPEPARESLGPSLFNIPDFQLTSDAEFTRRINLLEGFKRLIHEHSRILAMEGYRNKYGQDILSHTHATLKEIDSDELKGMKPFEGCRLGPQELARFALLYHDADKTDPKDANHPQKAAALFLQIADTDGALSKKDKSIIDFLIKNQHRFGIISDHYRKNTFDYESLEKRFAKEIRDFCAEQKIDPKNMIRLMFTVNFADVKGNNLAQAVQDGVEEFYGEFLTIFEKFEKNAKC